MAAQHEDCICGFVFISTILLSFIMLKRTYVKKEFCLGKDFESAMRVAKLMEGK